MGIHGMKKDCDLLALGPLLPMGALLAMGALLPIGALSAFC